MFESLFSCSFLNDLITFFSISILVILYIGMCTGVFPKTSDGFAG